MKKLFITLFLIAAMVSVSFAAVRIVDPSTSTVYVDEGFESPYVLELSNQEGTTLTPTEMAAITKIRVYFGNTEYVDSDTCPACFNYSLYASNGRIILTLGSYNWTDGTNTATLFTYSESYPLGRRIGTFSMTASQALSIGSETPFTIDYIEETELDSFAELINQIGITGTPDGSKYLRDDGTWQTVSGGSGAVDSVNGEAGAVVLDADDIDDTSTTNKWVTTALINAWNAIVSFPGFGTSHETAAYGDHIHSEYLEAETDPTVDSSAEIVAIIGEGVYAPSTAEQNIQSDWTQADTGADDYIKNKPTIPEGGTVLTDEASLYSALSDVTHFHEDGDLLFYRNAYIYFTSGGTGAVSISEANCQGSTVTDLYSDHDAVITLDDFAGRLTMWFVIEAGTYLTSISPPSGEKLMSNLTGTMEWLATDADQALSQTEGSLYLLKRLYSDSESAWFWQINDIGIDDDTPEIADLPTAGTITDGDTTHIAVIDVIYDHVASAISSFITSTGVTQDVLDSSQALNAADLVNARYYVDGGDYTFGTAQTTYALNGGKAMFNFGTTSWSIDCQATDNFVSYYDGSIHEMSDGYSLGDYDPEEYDYLVVWPEYNGSDYYWRVEVGRGNSVEDVGP